ncbi:MAG: iron-containing alcohol dehydrogenase [Candidatus Poribacteria bacterium]
MDSIRSFDVMMPTRIVFGVGRIAEVGKISRAFGKKALLITYKDAYGMEDTIEKVSDLLKGEGISVIEYSEVVPDPPTEIINQGAEIVKKESIDILIGLGGGSAIDSAKAIGAVAVNGGDAWDYMACNPEFKKFDSAMPVIAIPTTSGTGSETTAVAVLTRKQIKSKGSIVNPAIFAKVAIIDPELSVTMPPSLTASTGIDAFGHAMEAFISKRSTPYVERLSPEAMKLIWDNLPLAYADGNNLLARANMAWASTLGGMMLAQSGVIGVHALSQALGAHLNIPHGIGVAIATPLFLEYNRQASSKKYIQLANELGIGKGLKNDEVVDEFIKQITNFLKKFNMPTDIKSYSDKINKRELIENAMFNAPLSLINNPQTVTFEDMEKIIDKII